MEVIYTEPEVLQVSDVKIANLMLINLNNAYDYVPLVFDTGASITVMSKSTSKIFGAKKLDTTVRGGGNTGLIKEMNLYNIEQIRLGNIVLNSLNVVVVEDESLDFGLDSKGNSLKVNGFLGWDIIEKFKWTYTDIDKTFIIEQPNELDNIIHCNMEDWDNMPIIKVEVDERIYVYGLDTGNTESILGEKIYKSLITNKTAKDEFTGMNGSKIEEVKSVKVMDIKINDSNIRIQNVSAVNRQVFPTGNIDVAGLFGVDLLKGQSWVLDYSNRSFSIIT